MVETGRTITINGTTNQIVSSAGAQSLASNRTWTLSLPQNIHTGATPTFAGLTLTGAQSITGGSLTIRAAATQDGVILAGRAGGTGDFDVTISPTTLTADRTLTLADGNTILVGGTMVTSARAINTSGALTGGGDLSADRTLSISAGGVTNAMLQNSSITVSAGTGMSGGGAVSLGGSVTLNNAGVTSITTNTGLSTNASATGAVTITNTGVTSLAGTTNQISVSAGTGAVTLSTPQNINTTADVNFGSLNIRNTRVSTSQIVPLGHFNTSETVFAISPTWTQTQLQNYFNSSAVTWVADSTAPGGYAISIVGAVNVGGVYSSGFPYITVDSDDIYYMECWIRNVSGTNTHYMGSIDYNESFTSLGGNPGSFGYWVMSNTNPGTSWTKVTGYITGFGATTGQFVAGTKYWTPQALFNYTGGGTTYISGWKVIKVVQQGNRTIAGTSLTINGATSTFSFSSATGAKTISTGGSTDLFLNPGGNVRIGTAGTSVAAKLQVGGDIRATGEVVAYAASDRRLKNNIQKIESPLTIINNISGYTFDWNENQKTYTGKDYGVIAQEIEEVMPELVITRENGYKAVNYEKIIPLLIESIKEQQNAIVAQQTEIKELRELINNILNK
jgi:hypothetical protein